MAVACAHHCSFILANGWAHARRKRVEVEKFYAQEVGEIVDGELYGVERLCPTGPPDDPGRLALLGNLRSERSRPTIKQIEQWAMAQRALPQSGLGKAIGYMSGIWKGLTRFLDDPRIPLDNNATEPRSAAWSSGGRTTTARSRAGAPRLRRCSTAYLSAKLAGVEPKGYLRQATMNSLRGENIPIPSELT